MKMKSRTVWWWWWGGGGGAGGGLVGHNIDPWLKDLNSTFFYFTGVSKCYKNADLSFLRSNIFIRVVDSGFSKRGHQLLRGAT